MLDMLNRREVEAESLQVKHPVTSNNWCNIKKLERADIQLIVRGPNKVSKVERLWEEKYGKVEWKRVYGIMKSKVIHRKVREFHWKSVNLALFTENRLKHFVDSDGMCCLCGSEEEDMTHMLLNCELILDFWNAVIILIKQNVPNYIYTESNVILGCTQQNTRTVMNEMELEITNLLLMIAKWTIWKRRCLTRYEGTYISQNTMWQWYTKALLDMVKMKNLLKSTAQRNVLESIKIIE